MNESPATYDATTIHRTMFREAYAVARESTCPAKRVGAVIVRNGRILAAAANQAPTGTESCADATCIILPASEEVTAWLNDIPVAWSRSREYSRHRHAELTALIQCARLGHSVDGADLYVTVYPCIDCSKYIADSSIKRVFVPAVDGTLRFRAVCEARRMLDRAGVEVVVDQEADRA